MKRSGAIWLAALFIGAIVCAAARADEGSSIILETANPEDPPVIAAPIPPPPEPVAPKAPVVETKPEEQAVPDKIVAVSDEPETDMNAPALAIAKDAALPVTPLQPRNP